MKIVILVDYSSTNFNIDFKTSNMLISSGHNVFLAINDEQFKDLGSNCDKKIIGCSVNSGQADYKIDSNLSLDQNINNILN